MEALLLGIWKNIQELEESITLTELELILKEAREREMRQHRFMAAIQGIDLDSQLDKGEDRVEAAKRRVAAQQAGKSAEEADFDVLDMDYEVEN